MSIKILKNPGVSDIVIEDMGNITVPASGQITLEPVYYWNWAKSDDTIAYLTAGTLVMNDGSTDLSATVGIIHLQTGIRTVQSSITDESPNTLDEKIVSGSGVNVSTIGTTNKQLQIDVDTSTLGQPDKIVHVAKNGNDTTGDGTFYKPYLTIKKAAESITDSATNNRYAIRVAPGTYSEDNPITIPAYTIIEGVGKGVVKVVAQNDNKIFISSFLSRFQNMLIIGNGTSNEVGIYCGQENGQTVMWDITFIDTYIGLQVDDDTAWCLAYNMELLTAVQEINTGILVTSGRCQIISLSDVTQSESEITYGVRVVGSNSIADIVGIGFNSSDIETGIYVDGGVCTASSMKMQSATYGVYVVNAGSFYVAGYSIVSATAAVYVSGSGSSFAGHAGHILLCTIGVDVDNGALCRLGSSVIKAGIAARMNNGSTIEAANVDVHESTLNLDVVDSASSIYMSGGDVNKDRIRYQQGIEEDYESIAFFISRKPGDESLSVFGELHVGRPDLGFESVFGEGNSYTIGMTVLTSDNTATSTTDGGNLTDVSTEATEIDTDYFGFQGTTANHCIYITTDVQNTVWTGALDYSRLTGIEVSQVAAAVEVTPQSFVFEYWNGSAWVDSHVMCTHADLYHRYAEMAFLRANSSEHIRFGRDLIQSSVKKTINGKERHWIRVRIKNNLTTAPTFNQWKISNNRTEINKDGTITFHGTSKFVTALAFQANTFGETGGVTDAKFDVGSGSLPSSWSHVIKNSRLNGNRDAIYATFALPAGICTACPISLKVKYVVLQSGASSDGTMKVSFLPVQAAGVRIANPDGSITPLERPLADTEELDSNAAQTTSISINLSTDNKVQTVSSQNFDISEYYEGDIVFFRVEYDDNGSGNKDIAVIGVDVEGVKWTLGGRL